ncbi:PREDICTED: SPRY domain-containing SOCS box protein 3-like [Poecilia mexicana]|uniref:SPRY domain-containing SOCS box protein 3 n=1 Tax=Poecilia mexicana TaxID=48701 RepID=A0A3B3YPH2_9TELE|nr:PREDICTED: SPRY domain-containing SOCS box protein 3-like [Poecilia formosa]XP_014831355.1 PREDICTED: SPRY domain-containing SOCS box protein 3-like [Poecilia mexicana]
MSLCSTTFRETFVRAAMLRRSRSGKTRHVAWSETRQDADVMAAADREEWDSQSVTQIGELDSDMDQLVGTGAGSEVVVLPFAALGKRESFSICEPQEELNPSLWAADDKEEDQVFDWVWDERCKSSGASLSCNDRKVSFHSDYSCGTAAIRGNRELSEGQHYWEVKMTSPVYGTDMMVGVGTSEVNLDKFKFSFGSLLGHDEDSWGLSYTGLFQHKGDKVKFSPRFGQGSVIGVHLDTWHGTLTFYKNRHCIGVAATRLQSKKFYPMVCSTAAKSSMKVVCACFAPTSLQYLCCARLRQMLPSCPDVVDALQLPPGLRTVLQSQLDWVFALSSSPDPSEDDDCMQTSVPSSPSACAEPAPQDRPAACHCPPTPPSSDYDSCCSDPEDYQCKRCRWT